MKKTAQRRDILRAMGAAALAAGADLTVGCSPAPGGVLRAVDTHPEGYSTVEAVRYMGQLLTQRSEGRLAIEQYPGGVLGQEKDALEITIFGGVDLNRVNLAPLTSIVPETAVPALPFLFRSQEHMRLALDGPLGQRILEMLTPHGLIGLCFYDSGARSFYTTSRIIDRPEDLRGLKIRVQSSDLFVEMVRALGASPTPMDFGEVYQGLLQGTIDGAENNWPSYENTRHFEAAPFYSETMHVIAPEVLTMSAITWERLTTPDRELIRQCALESVPYMRTLWDERERIAREALVRDGVTVHSPNLEPFQALVQPVWDKFATTPVSRALVADILAVEVPQ